MAQQNGGLRNSKKRSHSSPELLTTFSGTSSSDQNIQRILDEFSDIKDGITGSSSAAVAGSTQSMPVTAVVQSPERSCKFRKGLKMLRYFLYGRGGTPTEATEKDNNDKTVTRPRSKSVCATVFNRMKSKPKSLDDSSCSDGSESDADGATASAKAHKSRKARISQRRKQKRGRSKPKSWRNSLSIDLFRRRHPAPDEEEDQDSQVDNPVASSSAQVCPAPDGSNDVNDLDIPPSLHDPVTLADMLRNHQQQPTSQRTGTSNISNRNIPDNPDMVTTTQNIYAHYDSLLENGTFTHRTVHTQIDYMHCLIPDQWRIINAPYYWGQINRFEADDLLEGRPEGTFILRDSSQEEFVFSVSFRRYGRNLHARIEQWNHKFTFDAHDPGVYSSKTICDLVEHYKDPSYCMFFEPMLTLPLLKKNPQSLQELCRARICSQINYNDISSLRLPIRLREYLRVYHYKQRLRVRKMEVDDVDLEDNNPGVITNTCLSNVHAIVL